MLLTHYNSYNFYQGHKGSRGVQKGGVTDPLVSDCKWCQPLNLQEKTRERERQREKERGESDTHTDRQIPVALHLKLEKNAFFKLFCGVQA